MIWNEGFTASYYMTIVDPKSWRDIDRLEITGGSIDRNSSGLYASADVTMTELPEGGETWIRLWMDAEQDGVEHVPLFTGLTSAPERSLDGMRETYKVECFSALKPMDDVLTERGTYIPTEVAAPKAAERLLKAGPAPVVISAEGELPRLKEAIVAEDGETNLTLALKTLDAVNWRLQIDGRGIITLEPNESRLVQVFGADNDVIEPKITDEYDWYACPNVLRAISDDLTAIARDDDPGSALSTVSRGREIWAEETSVNLSSNESIAAYAYRRLKELQSPARTISYNRRFDPDVMPGDVVMINHPEVSIKGSFKVVSQRLELGHGCRTSEKATLI